MKTFIAAVMACLFFQFQPVVAQAANLVANVDITRQTMTVSQNGIVRYQWKVSTGRSGFGTPTGNYKAKWLSKNHRSRKYNNAPMPYAVFFKGGYAIHGTFETKRLGRPASHGCVRLDPRTAAFPRREAPRPSFSVVSGRGVEPVEIRHGDVPVVFDRDDAELAQLGHLSADGLDRQSEEIADIGA